MEVKSEAWNEATARDKATHLVGVGSEVGLRRGEGQVGHDSGPRGFVGAVMESEVGCWCGEGDVDRSGRATVIIG